MRKVHVLTTRHWYMCIWGTVHGGDREGRWGGVGCLFTNTTNLLACSRNTTCPVARCQKLLCDGLSLLQVVSLQHCSASILMLHQECSVPTKTTKKNMMQQKEKKTQPGWIQCHHGNNWMDANKRTSIEREKRFGWDFSWKKKKRKKKHHSSQDLASRLTATTTLAKHIETTARR